MTRRVAWQTAATLVATVAVGRWAAGPGFGYTLFALVWVPTAAACLPSASAITRQFVLMIAWAAAGSLPWFFVETPVDACRLSVLLTVWTVTVMSVRAGLEAAVVCPLFRRNFWQQNHLGPSAAVSVVVWLTWLALPLTRADVADRWLGERGYAFLLDRHPVLVANAVASSAADWTHGSVAYRCLTVLGQDVPFDPPASLSPGLWLAAGLITLMLALRSIIALVDVRLPNPTQP